MSEPPIYPASNPCEIAPDLFAVYGSIKVNPIIRFTRTMTVVRQGGELTLISPVRLDDPGLAALEALGNVRHVMRLGAFHGLDDAFYTERYGAEFWSFPGGTTYTTPAITHEMEENGALPFADATLFQFNGINEPEGAICLHRGAGILITVDAIQSYATAPHKPHTNLLARIMMPFIGFPNVTLVGPIWTKVMTEDKASLRREFERLLQLPFDQLIAAHGTFLPTGAHAAVEQAMRERFQEN